MRAYGGVDLERHSFLTSAVHVWAVLQPGDLSPQERDIGTD